MNEVWMWLITAAETIALAMVTFYFQRAQKKRDEKEELHAAARKKEALLSMELQMASAKLSFAVAMAIKRGSPNGEVEEGITAYEKAEKKYTSFLKEQATEHMME